MSSSIQLQKLRVSDNFIYGISQSLDIWKIPYGGTHNWTMVSDGTTKFIDIALEKDFIFGISGDYQVYKQSYLENSWFPTANGINVAQIKCGKYYIYCIGLDKNLYKHTYSGSSWNRITDGNDNITSFDIGHNFIYAIRDTPEMRYHSFQTFSPLVIMAEAYVSFPFSTGLLSINFILIWVRLMFHISIFIIFHNAPSHNSLCNL